MQTKLSARGRVALPVSVRKKLGIRRGDLLDIRAYAGRIMLTPRRTRSRKARILVDPITGLPVLSAGPDAPLLTSEEVNGILFGKL